MSKPLTRSLFISLNGILQSLGLKLAEILDGISKKKDVCNEFHTSDLVSSLNYLRQTKKV